MPTSECRVHADCPRERLGDPSAPVWLPGGSSQKRDPNETHLETGCRCDATAHHRIRDLSSLWTCQGHAFNRATLVRRRCKFRGQPDLRTILPELPLGPHGVAVVQLCSAAIVDD